MHSRDRHDDEFRFLSSDAARVGRTQPLPEVDRVTLHTPTGNVSALRFAPEAAPRLVAVHGAGLNAHSFDPMMLALDEPGVSIDLPGHGRSAWRDDADYSPHAIAPAVSSALTQIVDPSQPIVLLGHSLGGLTALLVAAAHPELVTNVVIVDITPGVSPSGNASTVTEFITGQRRYDSIDEIVDRALAFGIGNNREALTRGVTLNTRVRDDGGFEWTHHFAHLDALPGGKVGDPHPYAALWPVARGLSERGVPITLLRASFGMVNDALAAEWQRELPTCPVETIAGPHNLHEATPVELAATIRQLL